MLNSEHPAASACTGKSPWKSTTAMDKDAACPVIKVKIGSKLCVTFISITACLLQAKQLINRLYS